MTVAIRDRAAFDADRPARPGPPRRRWPLVLAVIMVLVVLGGGVYGAFQTSLLGFKTTAVSGADPTLARAVELAVDVPLGTPLIRVDLGAIRARVLALPDVESASVSRAWPDGLTVRVVERVPVALTKANGALWLVDSSGTVYEKVDAAPGGLVTIQVARPGPDDPATRAALSVAATFPAGFRSSVASVSATSAYHVSVQLTDRKSVFWGSPNDNSRKMQILPALLRQPGKSYDISDPALPTAR